MRHLLTTLLTILAFITGVVATGYVGDQGRGLDIAPFVVGTLAAAGVLWWRARTATADRA